MTYGTINQTTGKLTKLYYDIPAIAIWKSITRLILRRYPIQQLLGSLDELIAEAADKQSLEKKYPLGFFKEDFEFPKRKSVIKFNLKNARTRKQINDNLKITDVAKNYGLKLKGNKCVCPFHNDTDPSLHFTDDKNVFYCFGCKLKGDIITFIKKMEELKNGDSNKKRGRS